MRGLTRAQLPLVVVLLLTAADCLSLAKGPSRRSPQPRLAKNAKKPKVFNLVCAGCGVECSGETSFIDHIHPKPKPKPTPKPKPKPKPTRRDLLHRPHQRRGAPEAVRRAGPRRAAAQLRRRDTAPGPGAEQGVRHLPQLR